VGSTNFRDRVTDGVRAWQQHVDLDRIDFIGRGRIVRPDHSGDSFELAARATASIAIAHTAAP
jgi:hypothetical protein